MWGSQFDQLCRLRQIAVSLAIWREAAIKCSLKSCEKYLQLLYFERGIVGAGVNSSVEYEVDKGSRGCLSIRDCSIHMKLCSRNILHILRKDF